MKRKYLIIAFALLFVACKKNEPSIVPADEITPEETVPAVLDPEEKDEPDEPGPDGSINFTLSKAQIANPERGFYV